MRHEKIIKREDGDTIKIRIELCLQGDKVDFYYTGSHESPSGNFNNKATPAEILATKLELWELIKPA